MKLIFQYCRIAKLTKDITTQLSDYYVRMVLMVCEYSDTKCYFGDCSDCPGIAKINEILQEVFDQSKINEISFKQWVSIDRTKLLLTITLPSKNLLKRFVNN